MGENTIPFVRVTELPKEPREHRPESQFLHFILRDLSLCYEPSFDSCLMEWE